MAPPIPPPDLTDDLLDAILLRLPPDEPSCLVRASLACKTWRRLVSDPGFLGRYRALHGTPPVLGFLHNLYFTGPVARFVPTATPTPLSPPTLNCHSWLALDSRHGRVLLHSLYPTGLIVWDPITGNMERLPEVPDGVYNHLTAAVLCATAGCDHADCQRGPFVVVFAATQDEDEEGEVVEDSRTWASAYSSETGAWSAVSSIHLGTIATSHDVMGPSLLVGDAVYFILEDGRRILRYDLGGHALSVIGAPPLRVGNTVLVTAEDGGRLGAAGVEGYNLHLWSWRGAAGWVKNRVIELDLTLSMGIGDPSTKLNVVGFADGADTVFICANAGVFTVHLKSGRVRRVGKRGDFMDVVPYASFYTPDYGRRRLQQRVTMQ